MLTSIHFLLIFTAKMNFFILLKGVSKDLEDRESEIRKEVREKAEKKTDVMDD